MTSDLIKKNPSIWTYISVVTTSVCVTLVYSSVRMLGIHHHRTTSGGHIRYYNRYIVGLTSCRTVDDSMTSYQKGFIMLSRLVGKAIQTAKLTLIAYQHKTCVLLNLRLSFNDWQYSFYRGRKLIQTSFRLSYRCHWTVDYELRGGIGDFL